jgi:hypothetical protein
MPARWEDVTAFISQFCILLEEEAFLFRLTHLSAV